MSRWVNETKQNKQKKDFPYLEERKKTFFHVHFCYLDCVRRQLNPSLIDPIFIPFYFPSFYLFCQPLAHGSVFRCVHS